MTLQEPCRVVIVAAALVAVACGGASQITPSDPDLGEEAAAVESGVLTASAHKGPLPEELLAVLNCESLAQVFYQDVIDQLGAGKPFTKVVEAEEKHTSTLEKLYTKRLLEVPGAVATCGSTGMPPLIDITTACSDAVELEKAIAGSYEIVRNLTPAPPSDVLRVLGHLAKATEKHEAAFMKCSQP